MAHTSTPWHVYEQPAGGHIAISSETDFEFAFMKMVDVSHRWRAKQRANAAYIVKACNAYTTLIEEIKHIRNMARSRRPTSTTLRLVREKAEAALKLGEETNP